MSYASNDGAAGVPALMIPAGLDAKGQPLGVALIGDYLSEPGLFQISCLCCGTSWFTRGDVDTQFSIR